MHSSDEASGSGSAVIGIVGDRDPAYHVHSATEEALRHVPAPPAFEWLPTPEIARDPGRLARYAGFLVAPGSPYRSMDGALTAIRYAREEGVPLLGACGGFQHVVIEFVRDVAGVADADHEEINPAASHLAVTALACSLAGEQHLVKLIAGTRAAALYQTANSVEPFFCSYGLNPQYREVAERHGLVVSGLGQDGQVRILELPAHPFFVATLYVPMTRSAPAHPHPLVTAFVAAAAEHALASA